MMTQKVNELELLVVTDLLAKEGTTDYTFRPGHNCIWVSYGRINEYFIFKDGLLVDRQVD